MPSFKSQAQRRWVQANHPEWVEEWDQATPREPLPEHVPTSRSLPKQLKLTGTSKLAQAEHARRLKRASNQT